MIPYDEAMSYMPLVMRRLRLRAGHKTQTSALRAIRRNTGVGITGARMSEWESGRTAPSLRSLFAFLLGLGYDFKDLQDEIDHFVDAGAPPPAPAKRRTKESRRERRERWGRLSFVRRFAGAGGGAPASTKWSSSSCRSLKS